MQCGTLGAGPLNRFIGEAKPASIIAAGQRHTKIGGEVIPQHCRIVSPAVIACGFEKLLKCKRFRRTQEAEDTAFILREPASISAPINLSSLAP